MIAVAAHDDLSGVLGHHFDTLEQQREANLLGMWAFLATEVLFFGGIFAAYMIFRAAYPDTFAAASAELYPLLGAINTAILLTSSLTVALAVHSATVGSRRNLMLFLGATVLLALLFLGIKAYEYYTEYEHQLIPGLNFVWHGPDALQARLFFSLYFVATGLHALHMIIGIGVALVMILFARWGHYLADPMPVERFGLYWHFVDVVWIFLYPLFYLI
jgi:cytochrome c oxidase subunit III